MFIFLFIIMMPITFLISMKTIKMVIVATTCSSELDAIDKAIITFLSTLFGIIWPLGLVIIIGGWILYYFSKLCNTLIDRI